MTKDITFKVADFVAEITLNRPQKHNAVTPEMAAALQHFCATVDLDDSIRVVLLKGAGERAFCSGSDLNSLAEYPSIWKFRNRVIYEVGDPQYQKAGDRGAQRLGARRRLRNGACPATSASPAARPNAACPEVTRGWVGGGGASQMMPRLIGYGQAMRLLLTGEPIGAEEALPSWALSICWSRIPRSKRPPWPCARRSRASARSRSSR